jgi:glycosyltransferase involved in cell wall biosynthesis
MDFVPYYLRLKGAGFWPATKVLTDNQHLSNRILAAVDRLIVYSLEEKHMYDESLRDRLVFVPYPAKSGLVPLESIAGDYIFCGGSNKRDHRAFVEAMRGLPLKAIIVTEKPLPKDIPPNCEVRGRLPLEDYFALMARAKVVAVPLIKSDMPHGHSDISGALSLGKVVVTTKDASCGGYITDGVEGLLVPAGDIEGYRQAFVTLCKDSTKWAQMSAAALSKSRVFTYGVFGDRLVDLVRSMMPVNEINHQN